MSTGLLEFLQQVHEYFNTVKHPDVDTEKQILYRSMKLTEELGEFNEQIFTYLGKGKKEKLDAFAKEHLASEFADVVIAAGLVALSCDVNIVEALQDKMQVIRQRFGL